MQSDTVRSDWHIFNSKCYCKKGLRPIIQHENKKYNKIFTSTCYIITLINNIPLSIINNF